MPAGYFGGESFGLLGFECPVSAQQGVAGPLPGQNEIEVITMDAEGVRCV